MFPVKSMDGVLKVLLNQSECSVLPSGGWSMSPLLSQLPIGWMSDESTKRQKSLVLSLPSRRRRRRVPIMPITVAMETEVELRGSRASSFMPTLKSLEGGTLDCRQDWVSITIASSLTGQPWASISAPLTHLYLTAFHKHQPPPKTLQFQCEDGFLLRARERDGHID